MSHPFAITKVTLVSAALRHARDAENLLNPSGPCHSPDQAAHLAGFGPECVRKACLSLAWADRLLGHELNETGELVLEVLAGLDVEAHRYAVIGWPQRFPALATWSPEWRYQRTGATSFTQAETLVMEAREAVDTLVFALWADGRLPEGFPS